MYRTVNYCSVKDCSDRVHGRGLCQRHYIRMRRYGSTDTMKLERHGMLGSPEYKAWSSMITRCTRPNTVGWHIYKDIDIYEPWIKSFSAFYDHMGDRPSSDHSLDRIDGTKGYRPGNVRWATRQVQMQNRKVQKSNTSGYRGVSKLDNGWVTSISNNSKRIYLGYYSDVQQAAIAYDCAAIQLYGDEAKPNIL